MRVRSTSTQGEVLAGFITRDAVVDAATTHRAVPIWGAWATLLPRLASVQFRVEEKNEMEPTDGRAHTYAREELVMRRNNPAQPSNSVT